MTLVGSGRSAGLDALRTAAALMVVVFHLRLVLGVDFGPLNRVIEGGDAGVYVFFALSGYLLYRPFLLGGVDMRAYALKRAARILPGYFVALVSLTILTSNPLPLLHPLSYLTLSASYDIPLRAFLGNAWTLSAEILFYVSLPVIAAVVRGREIVRLAMLAMVSASAAMLVLLLARSVPGWLSGSFPVVVYAFVPGMILAVIEVRHVGVFRMLAAPVALVAGLALVLVETQTRGFPPALAGGIGSALLMGWLLQHRILGGRILGFAGGASYAMYLWHKDLFSAFGLAGLAIATIGACASWALVERPILGWAHRTARRWRPAASARQQPAAGT